MDNRPNRFEFELYNTISKKINNEKIDRYRNISINNCINYTSLKSYNRLFERLEKLRRELFRIICDGLIPRRSEIIYKIVHNINNIISYINNIKNMDEQAISDSYFMENN